MDKNLVMQAINQALATLEIPKKMLHDEAFIKKDLQMDSVELVQFVMEIKKSLGLSLTLEKEQDVSLNDLCQLILNQHEGVAK